MKHFTSDSCQTQSFSTERCRDGISHGEPCNLEPKRVQEHKEDSSRRSERRSDLTGLNSRQSSRRKTLLEHHDGPLNFWTAVLMTNKRNRLEGELLQTSGLKITPKSTSVKKLRRKCDVVGPFLEHWEHFSSCVLALQWLTHPRLHRCPNKYHHWNY